MERQVAWVTGASRGIGAAIADRLVSEGFYVVGTATSENGAEAITKRLQAIDSDQGSGEGLVLDVSDSAARERTCAEILEKHGKISVLINNAGITRDGLLMRMKEADWQSVIDTNLSAVFALSKLVSRPMMKARYGRIINISSVVASMGNPGQANYAAAKGGVEALTRALAKELGSRNITVNAIAPGFIQTDMTDELPDEQKQRMLEAIPAARLGQPAEVAAAVAFLASESAGYISGEVLHVNGGMYMG